MDELKLAPYLYVKSVEGKGRGVFTNKDIPPMESIEMSSVLVMDAASRLLLDKTKLHDYIFEWGEEQDQCCVAWGYISLYNHSFEPNCEYFMNYENQTIEIKTLRFVQKGEELTINYNGDEINQPVWFPVK